MLVAALEAVSGHGLHGCSFASIFVSFCRCVLHMLVSMCICVCECSHNKHMHVEASGLSQSTGNMPWCACGGLKDNLKDLGRM